MTRAAGRFRGRALVLAMMLLAAVAGRPATAAELNGYLELRAAEVDTEDEVFGTGTEETSTDAVDRRLYFLYNHQAWPRLRFWVGGTFDDADVTTRTSTDTVGSSPRSDRIDSDERRLRPYLGIGQRTRYWTTQLSWNRDERRSQREGFPELTTIRDGYFATVSFSPEKVNAVRGRLLASRNLDGDSTRQLRDVVRDSFDLEVQQQVTPELRWGYRGTLTGQTDERLGNETTTTSHRAEVGYSDAWADRRVLFDSQLTFNRRESVVERSGTGGAELPLFPDAGLAGRDDTPLLIVLPPEPGLIDDDVAAPTPVDLGLAPPGADEPWALGLDFGTATPLNTLFVWIDRDIEPQIAAAFGWSVYTSANNRDWVLREIVVLAAFDEFLRRFEVRFDELEARYVKLVVEPLAPTTPGATDFPDIFVTELDAFQRVATPEVVDTFERLIANTRARLLARRELYYEGSLDSTWTAGEDTRYNMRHGLFFVHPLAPEAQFSTRVAWEQFQQDARRDNAFTYSASLVVTPVERLQYTVSLTGREEQLADEIGGDQIGVLFYGRAALYQGVYLQLGVSRSYREDSLGHMVESTLINFTSRIEPRSDLIVTLFYDESASEVPSSGSGLADAFTRAAELNLTYTPVPTVYLYGQQRFEWRSEIEPDTQQRVVASWAPFPAATFRLGLNYDESWRELNELHTRVAGPFLRWNLNPRSYVQGAYTDVLEDSVLRRLQNRIVSAILRWGF